MSLALSKTCVETLPSLFMLLSPNRWIGGKIQLRPNIANLGDDKVQWEIEDFHGVRL